MINRILVGDVGDAFWLFVDGKGDFQNAVQVKKACQSAFGQGRKHLVVDLQACLGMDSTFMGTLTSLAIKSKGVEGGSMCVLNADAKNQNLLVTLGLDQVLEVDVEGKSWQIERKRVLHSLALCREQAAAGKEEQSKHVLECHQQLAEINEENRLKFKDVIQFIEQEIHAS
jgi:anti-anti-sigma regulatory factor